MQVHILIRINSIFTSYNLKAFIQVWWIKFKNLYLEFQSAQKHIQPKKMLDNLLKDHNLKFQCYNPSRNANSVLKQSKYFSFVL